MKGISPKPPGMVVFGPALQAPPPAEIVLQAARDLDWGDDDCPQCGRVGISERGHADYCPSWQPRKVGA